MQSGDCPECGGHVHDGTCHQCGLVCDQQFVPSKKAGGENPFYPLGKTGPFNAWYNYYDLQDETRLEKVLRLIRHARDEFNLPKLFCVGVLNRFKTFTRTPRKGVSYSILVALAILLESRAWNIPLLQREVLECLHVPESHFRKYRIRHHVKLSEPGSIPLTWKFCIEHDLPYQEVTKWLKLGKSSSTRALAAAACFLSTRKTYKELERKSKTAKLEPLTKKAIAAWFETTMKSIDDCIGNMMRKHTL